jgi:hypothetical protein
MTETKRYNVRGMSIDEILTVVERDIDGLIDENEENFRIDMQDAGFPAEGVNECIERRRAEKIAWHKATLADMRRFLEARWQGRSTKMSKTTRRHYTIEDLDDALDDERAKLVIWRSEAIRELRACLLGTQREASHGKLTSAK